MKEENKFTENGKETDKGLIETRNKLIEYSEKNTGAADLSDKDRMTFYIYRTILYTILFILLFGSIFIGYFAKNYIMIYKIINIILFGFIGFDIIVFQYQLSNSIIMKLFFNKNKDKKTKKDVIKKIRKKIDFLGNFALLLFLIITLILLYYKGFSKDFLILFLLIFLYCRAFSQIIDQIVGGYFAKKGRVNAFLTIFFAIIITIALKVGLNKNYILMVLFAEFCFKVYKIIKDGFKVYKIIKDGKLRKEI